MATPEMPWYPAMESALRPLNPYTSLLLLGLAVITAYVAFRGDSIAKTAWLVYLVSP